MFLNRKRSAYAPSNAHKLRRFDPKLRIEADDEMIKLLLIALLGLVPAISLAFSFDDNENQGKYTAYKEPRDDLDMYVYVCFIFTIIIILRTVNMASVSCTL